MTALALRNLVSHKGRTAATALCVAMGVAFLAGTLVLADTVRASLDGTFAQAYAGTDAYVRAPAPTGMGSHVDSRRPRLDGGLVEQVRRVPGVAGAEGRVEGYAQLLDRDSEPVAGPGDSFGAGWSTLASANPFRLVAGRAPSADAEAVIDRKSAKATGYRVGDRARVATRTGMHDITVVGIAAFGDADSPAGSSYVLLAHDAAPRLVGQQGRVDGITVVGAPGVSSVELRDRVAAALGEGVEVLTSDELVTELHGGITKDVTTSIRKLLLAFAALALFVSAFLVNNTFSILVAQRTKEVALLRLVGSTRRQVLRIVMGEAAALGAVGAAVGALAGVGVAAGLRLLVAGLGFDIPAGPLVVRAPSVLVPMAVGALVTLAAVLLPARRAGAVAPVAALRGAETDETARPGWRKLVGAVLLGLGGALVVLPVLTGAQQPTVIGLGAALVFFGLAVFGPLLAPPIVRLLGAPASRWAGAPAELARQAAARNSRRTAGAATALMIGVGMVTLISVFAASAKATVSRPFGAGQQAAAPDFVILSAEGGAFGFSPDLARRLEALPQLETVAAARDAMVQVGMEQLHLHAVDMARWGTMVDFGDRTPLAADEVSVLSAAARMKGWTIGTILTIRFPDTGERRFRIAATRTSGPPLLISHAAYEANVAEQLDTAVLIRKADSATREEAAASIRAVMRDYPAATLLDERGKSAEQVASIDQFANTVYVLLGLAVLIALIGIATTLALSVVEQTRDLGLLRAVGMTPRQVRAMVRWESLLIVGLGCAIGVSTGLFFGWAILRSFPDDVAFRIPAVQIAAVVSASALAAMAAAAGPARRASRVGVLIAVARP